MNDEELTRLAVQELLRDAKKFKERREAEFKATQIKRPMRTNKTFLGNTLRDVVSFNKARTLNISKDNRKTKSPDQKSPRKSSPLKRKLYQSGSSFVYKKPDSGKLSETPESESPKNVVSDKAIFGKSIAKKSNSFNSDFNHLKHVRKKSSSPTDKLKQKSEHH